jgi:oligopeptidase B
VVGRKNGCQFIRVIGLNMDEIKMQQNSSLKIKTENTYFFGEDGYYLSIYYTHSSNNKFAFSLENMRTPMTIYSTNLLNDSHDSHNSHNSHNSHTYHDTKHSKNTRLIKHKLWSYDVENYNINDYITRRIWINNKGVYLPVDILSKKNRNQNKNSDHKQRKNILLYGYSSYGSNNDNVFSINPIALVDHGFEYALINVRGSSYLGKSFYKDGKLLKRMNTFDDVNSIAEYFVKQGYHVNLEGRSAGGLLSTASSLLRPDLYTSVIAIVPFVDVLLTMADKNIPLTLGEWTEVGNTNIDNIYNYIKKYSPMNIIKEGVAYPNYYVEGGYNDARVQYYQPVKFVANLRYATRNLDEQSLSYRSTDRLILLKINMDSGHFNSFERQYGIERIADKYAFLMITNP